ncbi:MAG TPA: hypothetical protein VLD37_02110 [Candidatus Bilamarchaeum sp.]|nr:hypothetical protein [Candidatus Bilamarchaeum sp.]
MRGQAAIEFLMTYGWAIFALVLVLAALLSSGILSPNYLISEECTFGNNIKCDFALFNEGGHSTLVLNVFNGFAYKVNITEIELTTQDGKIVTGFPGGVILESGENDTFSGTVSGPALPESTIKRFYGNITYVSCAPELGPNCSTVQHTLSGRVVAKVIPQ